MSGLGASNLELKQKVIAPSFQVPTSKSASAKSETASATAKEDLFTYVAAAGEPAMQRAASCMFERGAALERSRIPLSRIPPSAFSGKTRIRWSSPNTASARTGPSCTFRVLLGLKGISRGVQRRILPGHSMALHLLPRRGH